MNRFTLAFLALGLGIAPPDDTLAATIYSQTTPEEPRAAFASTDDSALSQRIANSFSIGGSEAATVRSLRFIGGAASHSFSTDDFRVVFLEDSERMPGDPILGGDYDIGSAYSRQATGGPTFNSRHPDSSGGTPPLEYIINLPDAIALNPATTYWLSITNNRSPTPGWLWARADVVVGHTIASTSGSIEAGPWATTVSPRAMWFELNDHVVPEPSSFLILLSYLVAATSLKAPRHHEIK